MATRFIDLVSSCPKKKKKNRFEVTRDKQFSWSGQVNPAARWLLFVSGQPTFFNKDVESAIPENAPTIRTSIMYFSTFVSIVARKCWDLLKWKWQQVLRMVEAKKNVYLLAFSCGDTNALRRIYRDTGDFRNFVATIGPENGGKGYGEAKDEIQRGLNPIIKSWSHYE